jgi:hypothetical protein
MSLIFLSHSSIYELEAVALKHWLLDNGWDDVFLDLDPERGLKCENFLSRLCNTAG